MRKRLFMFGWTRTSIVTAFEVTQENIPTLKQLCSESPFSDVAGADRLIIGEADQYRDQRRYAFIDGLHRTTGNNLYHHDINM
jgi:hypothetical protein